MKTITYGLVEVLDALRVQYVIGIGEGAGANILARFGMDHPQRCLGLILIHCTSTVAGVMEYFRDKVSASYLTAASFLRDTWSRNQCRDSRVIFDVK